MQDFIDKRVIIEDVTQLKAAATFARHSKYRTTTTKFGGIWHTFVNNILFIAGRMIAIDGSRIFISKPDVYTIKMREGEHTAPVDTSKDEMALQLSVDTLKALIERIDTDKRASVDLKLSSDGSAWKVLNAGSNTPIGFSFPASRLTAIEKTTLNGFKNIISKIHFDRMVAGSHPCIAIEQLDFIYRLAKCLKPAASTTTGKKNTLVYFSHVPVGEQKPRAFSQPQCLALIGSEEDGENRAVLYFSPALRWLEDGEINPPPLPKLGDAFKKPEELS